MKESFQKTFDKDGTMDSYFIPEDEEHIRREKSKASDLKQSQWWKNQKGKGVCYYCKQRFHAKELTMDHIVPIIRGGKTSKSNVVACCKECNNQKKYLLPMEWEEHLLNLEKLEKEKHKTK